MAPAFTEAAAARRGLAGFFLAGMLVSFLGALLPVWGHHLTDSFELVAYYFLGLNVGVLAGHRLARPLVERKGLSVALPIAGVLAFLGFAWLSAAPAAGAPWWRLAGLVEVGLGAGILNTGLFHVITRAYELAPAATVNLAGTFFGLGCLVTSVLVAGTYYVYTVGSILFFLALIPAYFSIAYARFRFPSLPFAPQRPFAEVLADFKKPAAVLFTLLLFFQFGNEWAIAGWLPLFLVQRLGISPSTSLWLLALYWSALLVGRLAAQAILPRVSHGRFLLASVLSAWLGCTILELTNNLSGATVGILLTGGGFASVYPLVVERIGHRFPYYHPGIYNGIFSLGLTGGLLAPATLGWFADLWGIGVVMFLPFLGTGIVVALLGALWVEEKLASLAALRSG
ncbi:MAG: hypothetical protein SFV54_04500 [Bryobacteraceae bacterium]|nr:hypothetical protein [Bryobacteraceae bacterium]